MFVPHTSTGDMVGRKKTPVKSGNRKRSRSPARSKQAGKPPARAGTHHPKATATNSQEAAQSQPGAQTPPQDIAQQQKLLSIFQGTFDAILSSANFNTILQEVKAALFKREFDIAFGNDDFLQAYAARWSPTRTLCYASVFDTIGSHLDALSRVNSDESENALLKVLAIGGAAAELVAFGSFLSRQPTAIVGAITLVDSAPWGGVVEKLRVGLRTPPPLSKYASAALQAANTAINDPERLKEIFFEEQDVLALDQEGLAPLVSAGAGAGAGAGQQPILVTLLFTLNELFTGGGIGKTTTFLLTLTSVLPRGSLLLVIDSPGSYSETTVGKEAKRYPMAWLLDKILTGASDGDDEVEGWEKLESNDSAWFRLGGELRYPIPLEDMRYQMHLYRKGSGQGEAEDHEEVDAEE